MILSRALNNETKSSVSYRDVDVSVPDFLHGVSGYLDTGAAAQMKVSAVYACVNLLSNSLSKLPFFVIDTNENKRQYLPPEWVLNEQPNPNMTPAVFKKLMETWRLTRGNAYAYPVYSPDGSLRQLVPLDPSCVSIVVENDRLLYDVQLKDLPRVRLFSDEIIHLKGMTTDGIHGMSVLHYARTVVKTGMLQEMYQAKFYENGGRPEGLLTTNADLSAEDRESMREEWDKVHGGADNAFKTAVLSSGVTYQAVPQMSLQDAEFVASKATSVADIARFFGVPLFKINAGKESYSSNEQNAITYVTDTLSPIVKQYEEEFTLKLLSLGERQKRYKIKCNINAEMRGDIAARGSWYKTMREIGAYSVNDILAYEDLESVEGGDSRYASLNYVPLALFEELSKKRNQGEQKKEEGSK